MTEPVFLTLSNWAERRLTELLSAKDQAAFDDAFDRLVGPHASITVNGKHMSRAEYKNLFHANEQDKYSASVDFKGTVEVSKNSKDLLPTGQVGIFFEAKILREQFIFNHNMTASINLVVENHGHGEPEYDSRQATCINQVFIDVPGDV